MNLERFSRLKKQVADLQRQVDKAAGALEQLKGRLKKEFDCTIEEAKDKLKALEKERIEREKELEIAWIDFQEKWGDKLVKGE